MAAYDSATDTALAGQAYQRALAVVQQKRDRLGRGFGVGADGTMDNSDVGHLGSVYQGNLASVMDEQAATSADRKRGFGGTTGLAGKAQTAAHSAGLTKQATNLRDVADQYGQLTQEDTLAQQDYTAEQGNIEKRGNFALSQTLLDNPIIGDVPVDATTANAPAGRTPAQQAAKVLAAKQLATRNAQKTKANDPLRR